MTALKLHKGLTFCIAAVWLVNGLYCKVLGYVPRHKQIVAEILGNDYSHILTVLIGVSEVLIALWILSRVRSDLNAYGQMLIVGVMNILEFLMVPDLLLWGRFNSLFALIFILTVYFNEFYLNKKQGT